MSLHHLLYFALFIISFSGVPPEITKEPVVIAASLPVNERAEDDEYIPWLVERKLAWEDFYAEPRKNSEAVASTSTSLGISYQLEDGNLVYHISCNFAKQKSWGLLKTDYILSHEQGHFDITEIAARRLYGALSQYNFNSETYKQDINEVYNIIVKDKEQMQAEYDRITDHSRNRRLQYEWMEKIKLMLGETAMWAAYP
jgi:predicted secreted Zn-dependent protease